MVVPWSSLWTSPTQIIIEDVFILATSKDNVFDDDYEKRIQVTKERFLQMRELFVSPEGEKKAEAKSDPLSDDSWTGRLVAAIIRNVQVSIRRVHIRFEHSDPVRPFACGVCLGGVAAVSPDAKDETPDASANGSMLRKILSLDSLSAYWDSQATSLVFGSPDDFCKQMAALIGTSGDDKGAVVEHQYVIRPFSGRVGSTFNTKATDVSSPKIALDGRLEELHVSMHSVQFRDLSVLIDRFSLESRGASYRHLRPPELQQQNVNKKGIFRWRFAVQAVLYDLRQAKKVWSWKWIKAMVQDRREYVRIWYASKANGGGLEKLPQSEQNALKDMEARLNYDAIIEFRELGEALWRKRLADAEEVSGSKQEGWISRLVWGSAESEKKRILQEEIVVSGALLQDLTRDIHAREEKLGLRPQLPSPEEIAPAFLTAHLLVSRVLLKVHTFREATQQSAELASLELSGIDTLISLGGMASTHVQLELQSLLASEMISIPGKSNTALQRRRPDGEGALLRFGLATRPVDQPSADLSLTLLIQPVEINVSVPFINQIIEFVTTSENVVIDKLREGAQETYEMLQREVVLQLRGVASGEKRTRLNLDINVVEPVIMLAQNAQVPADPRMVASLSKLHLSIMQEDESHGKSVHDGKVHISMDFFYQQKMNLEVNDVRLMIAYQEDWIEYAKSHPKSTLLDKSSIQLNIQFLTFPTKYLPRIKLHGSIPCLVGNICAQDILAILSVSQAIAPSPPPSASKNGTAAVAPVEVVETDEDSRRNQLMTFFSEGVSEASSDLEGFAFDRKLFDVGKNGKVVEVSFSASNVHVVLYKPVYEDQISFKELVCLKASSLEVSFDQCKQDIQVRAVLPGFAVEDLLSQAEDRILLGDADTSTSTLVVTYVGVPRLSSAFAGVDHAIDVKMGIMKARLNQETILYVLSVVDDITSGMQMLTEARSPTAGAIISDKPEPEESVPQPSRVSQRKVHDLTSQLVLTAKFGGLQAKLSKNHSLVAVADLRLDGASMSLDLKNNGSMALEADFGYFEVQSCANESKNWSRICYTKHDSGTASCSVETFMKDQPGYPGFDTRLQLHMNTVKVVYRDTFIQDVTDYFEEMDQMRRYLSSAASVAIESGAKTSGKLKLDVVVERPLIFIPKSSQSDEYVRLDLGETVVMSGFSNDEKRAGAEVQDLSVFVKEIGIFAGSESDAGKREEDILKRFTVSLNMVVPVVAGTGGVSMSADVSKVEFNLEEKFLKLVSGVLEGNMSEQSILRKDEKKIRLAPSKLQGSGGNVATSNASGSGFEISSLTLEALSLFISAEQKPIASMHMNRLFLSMSPKMDMQFSMETLVVLDTRPGRTHDEIVSKGTVDGARQQRQADPLLRVVLQASETMTVDVMLHPLRCIVVMDCMWQLYQFQERIMMDINRSLSKYNDRRGKVEPPIVPISASAPNIPIKTLDCKVNARSLELLMAEDLKNPSSLAMCMKISSAIRFQSFNNSSQDLTAEISNFSVAKLSMADLGSIHALIIAPWRAGASMHTVPGRIERIDVMLSPLEVTFSHGDYDILMRLVNQTLAIISPASSGTQDRPDLTKAPSHVFLEPMRSHREASKLIEALQADPLVLKMDPFKSLSVDFGVSSRPRVVLTKDSREKDISLWVVNNGRLFLAERPDLSVVAEFCGVGSPLFLAPSGSVDPKSSRWVLSNNRLRLECENDLVIQARDGDVVLERFSTSLSAMQEWNLGNLEEAMEVVKKGKEEKEQQQLAMVSAKVQCLSLIFQGLRVRLVDDSISGQLEPLLQIQLVKCRVFISSWSSDLRAMVDLALSADHFDTRLQRWEPIFRGIAGSGSAMREGDCELQVSAFQEGKAMRIDVVSLNPVTLTCTRSLISSSRKMQIIWAGTDEQLKKMTQREISKLPSSSTLKDLLVESRPKSGLTSFHSYVIVNKTGVGIRWSIGISPPAPLGPKKGQNIAFWDKPFALRNQRNESDMLTVYLEDEAVPLLKRLPIDGSRTLCFKYGPNRVLVYEVRYELGSSVLELRSNMLVVNALKSTPVGLYTSADRANAMFNVLPGDAFAIPLELSNAQFFFGTESEHHLQLDRLYNNSDLTINGVLRFASIIHSDKHHYYVTAVGTPDVFFDHLISWVITIDAPLSLKNLLPVELHVRLMDGKATLYDDVVIARGASTDLLYSSSSCSVSLRMGQGAWSPPVQLASLTGIRLDRQDVHIDHCLEGKKRLLSFWIPFWIINNTKHPLTFEEIAPEDLMQNPTQFSGSKLHVSVAGEGRSSKLELASASATGTITLGALELGVRVFAAPSAFWRTKIVQFDDRYQLVNMCDRRICVGQCHTTQQLVLEPMQQIPFQWADADKPHLVWLKIAEDGFYWSGSFDLKEVSLFEIVSRKTGDVRARLTVQTTTQAPVTSIIVRPSSAGFSIYRLVNKTRLPVLVRQLEAADDEGEWVGSGEDVPYAWPEPSKPNPRVIVTVPGGTLRAGNGEPYQMEHGPMYRLDTVDTHQEFFVKTPLATREIAIKAKLFFRGPTKVLELTESVVHEGGIGGSASDNLVTLTVNLQFQGLSVSVIDAHPREVVHVSFGNVRALYEDGTKELRAGLDVQRLQIDSMLYNCVYPIVLWPKEPDSKCFLHAVMNQAKGYEGITFFNGVEFVMQEADVRVDEALVTHLLGALSEILAADESEINWDALAVPVPDCKEFTLSVTDMVYIRELYIGPVRLILSYSSCHWAAAPFVAGGGADRIRDWLSFINEIDGVNLDLSMLDLEDAYHSRNDLMWLVINHYMYSALLGFYSLLGAVPVLGAPVEMFRGLSSGVKEAFFLPAQGMTRSPADFGDGLRRGTSALFKGTIGALVKEVGKVTSIGSKVAAKLTLDEDYQLQRDKAAKKQAKHAGQGFLFAARDVGKGFFGGLTGVLMNPVRGAQREGLAGFGKGIVSGVVGVVAKPVVGILDATSQIAHGIKNSQENDRRRIRRPRQFDQTGTIQLFNGLKAEAQEVLHSIDHSRFAISIANFMYPELESLERTSKGKYVPRKFRVLLSNKAIFYLEGLEVQDLHLQWHAPLREIGQLKVRSTNIILVHVSDQGPTVRAIAMNSMEEAILIHNKIHRAIEEDKDRALNNSTADVLFANQK